MKSIAKLDDFLMQDSTGLASSSFNCPFCGKTHSVPIEWIRHGQGMIADIPSYCKTVTGQAAVKAGVIFDRSIEETVATHVISPLSQAGMDLE